MAVCLLLAGCGGSSKTQPSAHSPTTTGSAVTGAAVAAQLDKAIPAGGQLKNVKAHCPSTVTYPLDCHFTATAARGSAKFAGTATVTGPSGSTYNYSLNYAPAH